MNEITTIKKAKVYRVDNTGDKFNPDGPDRFLLKINKAQIEKLKEKGYSVNKENLLFVYMEKDKSCPFWYGSTLYNIKIKPYYVEYNSTKYQKAIFASAEERIKVDLLTEGSES